jgi:hypothetical protein
VDAIGVQGSECQFGRICALQVEPEVEPDLAALVANNKFAAGRGRWQHEDECGKHSQYLLGVTVAHEEASFVVYQKLVELGLYRSVSPKCFRNTCQNRFEHGRPVLALDPHAVCFDLPGPMHRCVDQGILASTVGARSAIATS